MRIDVCFCQFGFEGLEVELRSPSSTVAPGRGYFGASMV